jgi:hypothetical protein
LAVCIFYPLPFAFASPKVRDLQKSAKDFTHTGRPIPAESKRQELNEAMRIKPSSSIADLRTQRREYFLMTGVVYFAEDVIAKNARAAMIKHDVTLDLPGLLESSQRNYYLRRIAGFDRCTSG